MALIVGATSVSAGTGLTVTQVANDGPGAKYVFPSALANNGQDYLKFTAYQYEPAGTSSLTSLSSTSGSLASVVSASGAAISGGGASLSNSQGEVYLPIQSGISDSNMVSWGQDDLNAIDAQKAATAYTQIQNWNEESDLNQKISNLARDIFGEAAGAGKFASDYKKEIALFFASRAANVNNLLARVEGKVVNPNMELLFQGPALRPFSFQFKLSPRDSTEAIQIKNIIRFFKRKMAPERINTNLFLNSPHVFHIQYMLGNGTSDVDNPSINRIKLCALQSCNVDYTPDGNYATFEDGTMTSYGLSLQFTELVPIYSDDYANINNGQIGF